MTSRGIFEKYVERRRNIRSVIVKCYQTLSRLIVEDIKNYDLSLQVSILESRYLELTKLVSQILDCLYCLENDDDDVAAGLEAGGEYFSNFHNVKAELDGIRRAQDRESLLVSSSGNKKHHIRLGLSKFKLFMFNGGESQGISLGAQFYRVGVDDTLLTEDKIQVNKSNYRLCMLIESFPYNLNFDENILKSLKEQFGLPDDLLVKYYIGDLLHFILNCGKTRQTDLCNRQYALKTPNTALESYATVLVCNIEPSFIICTLKICQRTNRNGSTTLEKHISSLMALLKCELVAEEEVGCAFSQAQNKRTANKSQLSTDISYKCLTNISSINQQRIFCKECYWSSTHMKAYRMAFVGENKALWANSRASFFDSITSCPTDKFHFRCSLSKGRHFEVMCNQHIFASKSVLKKNKPVKPETEGSKVSHSLILGTTNEVYLQTFTAVLYNNEMERKVRVLVDSGSQRSYVRSSLVAEMGYQSSGDESLVHTLFGGRSAGVIHHSRFKIHLRSIADDYSCNFTALDQGMIAASIPVADLNSYIKEELEKYSIKLTEDMASPIDILIGADVAGKIWCGPRVILSSGLVAVNTLFGWTVMGAAGPTPRRRFNSATQTVQWCTRTP